MACLRAPVPWPWIMRTDDRPSTFRNSLDVAGNWGGKVYIANEVAAEELSKPLQNVTVKIVDSRVR